jgi:hypothetical protein
MVLVGKPRPCKRKKKKKKKKKKKHRCRMPHATCSVLCSDDRYAPACVPIYDSGPAPQNDLLSQCREAGVTSFPHLPYWRTSLLIIETFPSCSLDPVDFVFKTTHSLFSGFLLLLVLGIARQSLVTPIPTTSALLTPALWRTSLFARGDAAWFGKVLNQVVSIF